MEEAEPGKPRRRLRRGRKGNSRGNHEEKSWGSRDPALRSLLATLIEQTCSNTRKLRMVQASTMDTVIAEVTSPLVRALQQEVENYGYRVDDLKHKGEKEELRELGPPTAGLVVALVEALAEMDVGGAAKKDLLAWLEGVQPSAGGEAAISKQDIEDSVAFVRMEKAYDEKLTNILIGMTGWSLRPVLLKAFRAEGTCKVMSGPPPPGWMEDELSTWLEALELK